MIDIQQKKFDTIVNNLTEHYSTILFQNNELINTISKLWSSILKTRNHELISSIAFQTQCVNSSKLSHDFNNINYLIDNENYHLIISSLCNLPMKTIELNNSEKDDYKLHKILNNIINLNNMDKTDKTKLTTDLLNWFLYGYHTQWRESLYDFLSHLDHKLFLEIYDIYFPELLLDYLELLILYDCIEQLQEAFDFLINSNYYSTADCTDTQLVKFLWMSDYVNKDSKDSKDQIYNFINEDVIELEVFKYIKNDINLMNNRIVEIDTIKDSIYNSSMFMNEVKNKLWKNIDLTSIDSIRNKVSSFNQTKPQVDQLTKLVVNNNPIQYQEARLLNQIKPKTTRCTKCSTLLDRNKLFRVIGYNKKNKVDESSILHNLIYCANCDKIYTNHDINEKIKSLIGPYNINVQLDPLDYRVKPKGTNLSNKKNTVTHNKVIQQSTSDKVPEFLQRFIKTSPANTVTANKVAKTVTQHASTITLNEETALRKLGYQITGLTSQQRWKILQEKAIPKLPLKIIVNTIANNIRLRKAQKNGNRVFSNAISEWEHDLNRLKREYYRSDFKWPNY